MTAVRLVVVGAGLAALRAAQAARNAGFAGSITVIGDEPHMPYNRPPLSKQVLLGAAEPESTILPVGDLDATWILRRPAIRLDAAGRSVVLEDGTHIGWDRLILATGVRAREWPTAVPAGVHTLRGLDDVAVLATAPSDGPLVIVGAGFVGCEVAASMRELGRDVIVVEPGEHPMIPLGPLVGQRARDLHERHGVQFHFGRTVATIQGTDAVQAVALNDGTVIPAASVLVAIGGTPNVEWLDGSGIPAGRGGIVCDEFCEVVGFPGIFAAGDVASWAWDGQQVRVEHWTNAVEMGTLAGANAVGEASARTAYRPVPSVWSDQFGTRFQAVGFNNATAVSDVEVDDPGTGKFIVVQRVGDRLTRVVSMGAPPRAMARYQSQIRAEESAPVPAVL